MFELILSPQYFLDIKMKKEAKKKNDNILLDSSLSHNTTSKLPFTFNSNRKCNPCPGVNNIKW